MSTGRDDDVTLEVALPAELRPARNSFTLHVIKGPRAGEVLVLDRADTVLGRSDEADLRIEDPGMSRIHARFSREGDDLFVTDLDSRNGTMIEGQRIKGRHRLENGELLTLGNVVVRFAIQNAAELQVSRDLYEAAVRDRLTQLYNRGCFDDRLAAEFSFVRRHKASLAVLLIDLDYFKRVNDTHGHPAGDSVLKAVAQTVRDSLRAEDLAARYGGEEFVVLARGTDAAGALVLGERLRMRIEETDIVLPENPQLLRVTASVGIAVMRKDLLYQSPAELLAAADAALYEAKREGRNQVVMNREAHRERVDGSYLMTSTERVRLKGKKQE